MLLINRTFDDVTPESAEHGDRENCGFLAENEPVTFRELVDLLRDHSVPSGLPADGSVREWYSSGFEMRCYRTATERETSVHWSRSNPAHKARYWRLAAIAAGVVRRA